LIALGPVEGGFVFFVHFVEWQPQTEQVGKHFGVGVEQRARPGSVAFGQARAGLNQHLRHFGGVVTGRKLKGCQAIGGLHLGQRFPAGNGGFDLLHRAKACGFEKVAGFRLGK
jgi:hypothetical protein